jgi:hypothetical protein
MTFLEAINAIENLVGKMGIKYRDGSPMEPVVAMGRVAAFHGPRFDFVLDSLQKGDSTVEHYFHRDDENAQRVPE